MTVAGCGDCSRLWLIRAGGIHLLASSIPPKLPVPLALWSGGRQLNSSWGWLLAWLPKLLSLSPYLLIKLTSLSLSLSLPSPSPSHIDGQFLRQLKVGSDLIKVKKSKTFPRVYHLEEDLQWISWNSHNKKANKARSKLCDSSHAPRE